MIICTNCSRKITKDNKVTGMCWINNMELWVTLCDSCDQLAPYTYGYGEFRLQGLKIEES